MDINKIKNLSHEELLTLVKDINTDYETLKNLFIHSYMAAYDYQFKSIILKHPNMQFEFWEDIINDTSKYSNSFKKAIAGNLNYDICKTEDERERITKLFIKLANDDFDEVRRLIANNPNAPIEVMEILATDNNLNVMAAVAKNLNYNHCKTETDREKVTNLFKKLNYLDVGDSLAYNPNTPTIVLKKIANSRGFAFDYNLKYSIANHPNCSIEILEKFIEDGLDSSKMHNNPEIKKLINYVKTTMEFSDKSSIYVLKDFIENNKFKVIKKDIIQMLDYNSCTTNEEKQTFFNILDKPAKDNINIRYAVLDILNKSIINTDEERLLAIKIMNRMYNTSKYSSHYQEDDFMKNLQNKYCSILNINIDNLNEISPNILNRIPLEAFINIVPKDNENIAKFIIDKFSEYEESKVFNLDEIKKNPLEIYTIFERMFEKSYEYVDDYDGSFHRVTMPYNFGEKKKEFQKENIIQTEK